MVKRLTHSNNEETGLKDWEVNLIIALLVVFTLIMTLSQLLIYIV